MPAIKLVLTLQDGNAKTILLPHGSDKASFLSSLHQSYLVEHAPDATTYELLVPDLSGPDMSLSTDNFFHGLSTFLASPSASAAQSSLQATFPLVTFDGMGRAEIKDFKIRVTKRELSKMMIFLGHNSLTDMINTHVSAVTLEPTWSMQPAVDAWGIHPHAHDASCIALNLNHILI